MHVLWWPIGRNAHPHTTNHPPPTRFLAHSIHGTPSRAPPTWRAVPTVTGETLRETLYHVCDEGFAKVCERERVWRRDGVQTPPPQPLPPPTTPTDTLDHTHTHTQITINRPHRRNAFTPRTVAELAAAFSAARDDPRVGAIILTGAGDAAFCSGGDQGVRGPAGYVDEGGTPRLSVLDLQVQIRRTPKPVLALVKGYAVGGGNVLQVCCDLTIAADNAIFGQSGPKVGSFDGGYGCAALARIVGVRKAREIWYLARLYDAQEALAMGLVNAVVPLAEADAEAAAWCREMTANSPTALRVLKASLNALDDGAAGLQELAGNATLLFYGSEEGAEGRRAFAARERPDWGKFPRRP